MRNLVLATSFGVSVTGASVFLLKHEKITGAKSLIDEIDLLHAFFGLLAAVITFVNLERKPS
jgi:hypothetical protein